MTNAIILAYQKEKAMKSATPIYLHDLLDIPMIEYVTEAMNGNKKTLIVDAEEADKFKKYKDATDVKSFISEEKIYQDLFLHLPKEGNTIVSNGNTPMINAEQIGLLSDAFNKSNLSIVGLSHNLKPTGVFCINNAIFTDKYTSLTELLDKEEIGNYDIIIEEEFFPITNRYQLSLVENDIRRDVIKKHLFNGVSIKNIDSVTIGPKVEIGEETIIYPNTYITGDVTIGKGCKLGPFLRIRQSARLADGVKIGNFVELKNASMGKKSASAHLSYLGDTTIGEKVNVGCGVITVNYDGANKHHTTIEDDAFIGCNVNLIAPITIGKSALVAAGSTVSKDVPAQNLSFARARQINKAGYVRKRKKE